MPASDIDGNLEGYSELLERDPGNAEWVTKVNLYQSKVDELTYRRPAPFPWDGGPVPCSLMLSVAPVNEK